MSIVLKKTSKSCQSLKSLYNYNLNDEVSTLTPGPIVVVTATDLK